MRARKISKIAAALACALLLAGCCRPVLADEITPQRAEDLARELIDEIQRRTGKGGDDGFGAWTRSAIDRALTRTGKDAANGAAGPAPLPAEHEAATTARGLTAGPNTAQVIVFTSLAVPAASWRQWSREAALTSAPMVLRGVAGDGFRSFVKRIGARIGDSGAGAAIDPRLFRLFRIESVPAVAVVPGGVPPCASRGCADDPPPPHDLVAGNIGLAAALEAVAAEGGPGRGAARRHLVQLRGEKQ